MGHKNKESLVKEVWDALNALLRTGFSKHEAKKDGSYLNYIYSWETLHNYVKHCTLFVKYCRKKHRCKTLEECKQYIDEWLNSRAHLSPSTLKLEMSALRKLYGRDVPITFSTPDRRRADITRSRGEKVRDCHFSETKNAPLVAFCRSTGLRRSELRDLRGKDLIKEGGKYYIKVRNGKGGKKRNVVIIGDVQAVVTLMKAAGENRVFQTVHNAADIHSYRREYALAYYKVIARPLDTLSKKEKYYCRKDKSGFVYDRVAMLTVSHSLGHGRINIIAGHYLD